MSKEEVWIGFLKENHRELARLVGMEKLFDLAREYGGTSVYIPSIDELQKVQKYLSISEGIMEGVSAKKLARRYGVSESTVYKLARNRESLMKHIEAVKNRSEESRKKEDRYHIPGQIKIEDLE